LSNRYTLIFSPKFNIFWAVFIGFFLTFNTFGDDGKQQIGLLRLDIVNMSTRCQQSTEASNLVVIVQCKARVLTLMKFGDFRFMLFL
ncbi:hypothetical protein, partial [Nostoc sp.]|uniref:hypothetical protein n=1 Tax=Nostoc sp. TaxID=1180 RepID=UPI002FFA2B29